MKRRHLDRVFELVYQRLYTAYGPQYWWPADSPFEVMVGAILTQNTAWTNVEKAIANLKTAGYLEVKALNNLSAQLLAEHIRPSGYFNIKAKRLKNFCQWLHKQGGLKSIVDIETKELRQSLLTVSGIGPETADDMLLYALQRPVFVIDSYTRRLFSKLEIIRGDEDYETLRNDFEAVLPADVGLFNEYHALIVRHAKEKCADNEICDHCIVEAPIGYDGRKSEEYLG